MVTTADVVAVVAATGEGAVTRTSFWSIDQNAVLGDQNDVLVDHSAVLVDQNVVIYNC